MLSRSTFIRLVGATVLGIWLAGCTAPVRLPPADTQPRVVSSPTAVPATETAAATTTASPAPATPAPLPTATERVAATATEAPTPVVLVGAGDIANCDSPGAEITARLIEHALLGAPGAAVFTAGDNTNELDPSPAPLKPCFDPTWGRFKERIRPAPGNHDYFFEGASDYFAYFGAAAGQPGQGWYSYDLGPPNSGGWHIVMLNSECDQVGGCQAGSPQETWLKADLAAAPGRVQPGHLAPAALQLGLPRQPPRHPGFMERPVCGRGRAGDQRARPRLRALCAHGR